MAPREDGGGDFAGIDPALMRAMIKDLETGKAAIEAKVPGLKGAFEKVGLSTRPIAQLTGVAAWIGGELPMLNRRQAMAEQLMKVNSQFGFGSGMVQTEWEGHFKSKAEAEAKAKELAAKYQKPGGFPDDVWSEIIKYQDDPDFAEAFLKALGPQAAAWVAGRLRTWGEPHAEERLAAFGRLMATASHRGVLTEQWLERFHPEGQGHGPSLYDLAALIKHGTWSSAVLVAIGKRGLGALQAGGGNQLTADLLGGIARNPLAAHELYQAHFDQINQMAYGRHYGWQNTDNPKLGDPLAAFLKAATVEAAAVFERQRPPGDEKWVNPAELLALKLFEEVAKHPGERFPFPAVENAYIDIVQQFFEGTYIEELIGEGGLTWVDAVQLTADLAGVFDPTPISDGISGLIALGQGDWKGALLSAASLIPWLGDAAAKPAKAVLKIVGRFPALKVFFKDIPDEAFTNPRELAKYAQEIEKGLGELENTLKNVDTTNVLKVADALSTLNRMHTDAEKIYARFPRWKTEAAKAGLPTDGPIPFVPPKNWDPNRIDKRGIVDAYGNVWQRGKNHQRNPPPGASPHEWDVQVKSTGGLKQFTADGRHLNVEWNTGRVAN